MKNFLRSLLIMGLIAFGSIIGQAQTNFPNGVLSYGMPILGLSDMQIPNGTGKVFFVDTTNGNNGYSCLTPVEPCKTIGQAHTLAGDGRGDTIIVYPGTYAENITITKDYITLRCAQYGYAKPDVAPTSGVALTVNDAQGFRSYCMRYAAPAADTDLVIQEGNGFYYVGNVFDGDATMGNTKALLRLEGDDSDDSFTASEGFILGNLFRASGGVAITCRPGEPPSNGVGCSHDTIAYNTFTDQDQCDITTQDSAAGGSVYSMQFMFVGPGNLFQDKNATCYIDFTTANGGADSNQSGTIFGNYFADDALAAGGDIKIVGTGFTFVGNYTTVGVADGSGLD